jgi:hypothetical protein
VTPTDRTTATDAEFVARFAPFDPALTAPVLPVTAWLQQLDELRAAATPGPWEPWTGSYGGVGASTPDGDIVLDYSTWVDNPEDHREAQALTALIVVAVNSLGQLTAAIRAVLTAHVPWYEIKGVRHEHTVNVSCEDVGCDGESCDGEHEVPACQECRWSDGDVDGYQFWPCPTVRAIRAAIGSVTA